MPWLSEAMKDVISCDKLRGLARTIRSVDFRMGQPGAVKRHHSDLSESKPPELKHLSRERKRKQK